MKDTLHQYSDIILTTEDGEFQLRVDSGLTGSERFTPSLHTHTCHELFFVSKGTMDVVCMARTLSLSENTILVIPPETLHYTWSEDPDLQRYALTFKVLSITENNLYSDIFNTMTPVVFREPAEIQENFRRLSRYACRDMYIRRPLMAACFHEMLYLLKAELTNSTTNTALLSHNQDTEYRNYLIDTYLSLHYNTDASLATLASMVHMSERNVNRIIQKNYGQNFRERVVFLKMQNTVKLLTETDMTVKSIAAQVGYKVAGSFYETFQRYHHMTPEQYRKNSLH